MIYTRNLGQYTPFFLAPVEGLRSPSGFQLWYLATTNIGHPCTKNGHISAICCLPFTTIILKMSTGVSAVKTEPPGGHYQNYCLKCWQQMVLLFIVLPKISQMSIRYIYIYIYIWWLEIIGPPRGHGTWGWNDSPRGPWGFFCNLVSSIWSFEGKTFKQICDNWYLITEEIVKVQLMLWLIVPWDLDMKW